MTDIAQLTGLLEAGDEPTWTRRLVELARVQGFGQVLFGLVSSRHAPFDSAFVRTNYSPAWRARYDACGFARVDPTVLHCLSSTLPLVWSRASFGDGAAAALYEEACTYGLCSGVTLPIHGPQGELGLLSFASELPANQSTQRMPAVLPALALIRDYAFASAVRFCGGRPQAEVPHLTRREREVLQWVMAGKSSWEIARITACSEATINFHLANVRQKFGVNTRQQAVVKALGLGLITADQRR